MTTGLRSSLLQRCRKNKIPICLENLGEQSKICVSTANEKRAREIVREIVEGAPPE